MCIENGCDTKRGDLAIEQNIFPQTKNKWSLPDYSHTLTTTKIQSQDFYKIEQIIRLIQVACFWYYFNAFGNIMEKKVFFPPFTVTKIPFVWT